MRIAARILRDAYWTSIPIGLQVSGLYWKIKIRRRVRMRSIALQEGSQTHLLKSLSRMVQVPDDRSSEVIHQGPDQ